MFEQREALLRLLRDDDPETLSLVKNQMASQGVAALPEIRSLLTVADPAATQQLREVIALIEAENADANFSEMCASFGVDGDLEEAAWRLAAIFFPGEAFERQRALLDEWSSEVVRRLESAESEVDRIETLVEFLSAEVGLRGNEEDYYNINNSLLPEVIDTRLGLPITLSLIYMIVGRRAGLPVDGVGLPGHFLIRCGQHFFDPFFGGKRVGLDECRARLQAQHIELAPAHLEPVSAPYILLRILNNIRAIADKSDPVLAETVQEWMGMLQKANWATET